MTGRKESDTTRKSDTTETRTSSDCSGQYSLIHFQITLFTKVILMICLITEMSDWKIKLKNQWVEIEISCVQPGKPGNLLQLVFFPFQYSSVLSSNYRLPTSTVCCLLSAVYCLLSTVHCSLSTVHCLLSTVYCKMSTVIFWLVGGILVWLLVTLSVCEFCTGRVLSLLK